MATQQWINQWSAMLTTIRNIGCDSKIWTSVETCNGSAFRFNNPPDPEVVNLPPDYYINAELSRLRIRGAQTGVQNLSGYSGAGPNLDLIDWRLRAYGDGVHFGELGLMIAGQAWARALFG